MMGKRMHFLITLLVAVFAISMICYADTLTVEEIAGNWKREDISMNFDTWQDGLYEQYYHFHEDGSFEYEVYLDGEKRGDCYGTWSVGGENVNIKRTGGDTYQLKNLIILDDNGKPALAIPDTEDYYYKEEESEETAISTVAEDGGAELNEVHSGSGTDGSLLSEEEQKILGFWMYNTGDICIEFYADHSLFQTLKEKTVIGTWEVGDEPGKYNYTLLGQTETMQMIGDDIIVRFMENSYTVHRQKDNPELREFIIGTWRGADVQRNMSVTLELRADHFMRWTGDKVITGTWNEQQIINKGDKTDIYVTIDTEDTDFALIEVVGDHIKFVFSDESDNQTQLYRVEDAASEVNDGAAAAADIKSESDSLKEFKDLIVGLSSGDEK